MKNERKVITIKGYTKECKKNNKKFTVYIAVTRGNDGKGKYANISFCKDAFDKFEAIKKEFNNEVPHTFKFDCYADSTSLKRKVVFAKDELDNIRCTENGEPISFENTKLYVSGDIMNFTECNDVFDGIGESGEEFGR